MSWKVLAVVQFILTLLLGAALLSQYVSVKRVSPVVREPAAPGESTLAYTPPPPPKIALEALKDLSELKKAMTPTVEKITEDIYLARGFALGSVQMVITDEGLVIIDTTESKEAAREIFDKFREITTKPVRFIIYTHGHLDHVCGTPVFLEEGTEVVATKDLVRFMERDFRELKEFHVRSRLNQSGNLAQEYSRELPVKPLFRGISGFEDLVWPTITFGREYSFELGGKAFELLHTTGETPDHLMVWMPEERALFCGDLYYASFPNLSTPMLEPRPVKGWVESLDRMIEMEPEYLIPGHTPAIVGAENVREVLTHYSKAILHVYERTVACINEGKTVEQAVQSVRLPEDLAGLPYLRELYGRVDWSVRDIYRGLTGWYDGRGTDLAPLAPSCRARETVALAGGADKILARAIELQKNGEHQLAIELCDIVIDANPDDKLARIVKANSLEALAFTGGNLNMFGFYRSAAALERQAAGVAGR
jgi:alkyl sulfatase BDS1-like metallo-beta-lactamase superfamily hydrolase